MTQPNEEKGMEERSVRFISKHTTFGFLEGEHVTTDGLTISPLYFDSHTDVKRFYGEFIAFIHSENQRLLEKIEGDTCKNCGSRIQLSHDKYK
jgi:hypothetical protein